MFVAILCMFYMNIYKLASYLENGSWSMCVFEMIHVQTMEETTSVELAKPGVKRPMNAFLIFCKRHRGLVREKNPNVDNRAVTRILGDLWTNLDLNEKLTYTNLAKQVMSYIDLCVLSHFLFIPFPSLPSLSFLYHLLLLFLCSSAFHIFFLLPRNSYHFLYLVLYHSRLP